MPRKVYACCEPCCPVGGLVQQEKPGHRCVCGGELREVGHVVPIDSDDSKNWIDTRGSVPTYAPHKAYGIEPDQCRICRAILGAAAQKPASVEPGQRWTCVGIDGTLEVRDVTTFTGAPADVGLRPDGSDGPATVRAREVDMLGLAEWRFVG